MNSLGFGNWHGLPSDFHELKKWLSITWEEIPSEGLSTLALHLSLRNYLGTIVSVNDPSITCSRVVRGSSYQVKANPDLKARSWIRDCLLSPNLQNLQVPVCNGSILQTRAQRQIAAVPLFSGLRSIPALILAKYIFQPLKFLAADPAILRAFAVSSIRWRRPCRYCP